MNTSHIRSEIHQVVTAINPLDQMEQEHIRFVLAWIESGTEIFRIEKPATLETHLVSYFVITSPNMDQIFLVDHKKAKLWLPPGGHVDPGEDPKETVRREAKPLFLTVTKTVGNIAKHTDVSLWYLLKCDPSQSFDYDINEFNKIRWFSIDEVPFEKSDPHMKRFLQKMSHNQNLMVGSMIEAGKWI